MPGNAGALVATSPRRHRPRHRRGRRRHAPVRPKRARPATPLLAAGAACAVTIVGPNGVSDASAAGSAAGSTLRSSSHSRIATQSPMPSFHTKASLVTTPDRQPAMISVGGHVALIGVAEVYRPRFGLRARSSGAAASAAGAGAASGGGGTSDCASTTMGAPQLLQRIFTFRPRTLSSAIVYLPHRPDS